MLWSNPIEHLEEFPDTHLPRVKGPVESALDELRVDVAEVEECPRPPRDRDPADNGEILGGESASASDRDGLSGRRVVLADKDFHSF